jgi:hypothetical protein
MDGATAMEGGGIGGTVFVGEERAQPRP